MTRPASGKLVVLLLSLNAMALLLIAALLLTHSPILPAAYAQALEIPVHPANGAVAQAPSPTGMPGQFLVAPGQFASNVWGCYVLDVKTQTLCAYVYQPGERILRLQAARGISQDLQLHSFNTDPAPAEVARLLQKERELQNPTPPAAGETDRK